MEIEQRHYDDRFCVMFYILHSPLDIKRYTLKGFVECKSLYGLMACSLLLMNNLSELLIFFNLVYFLIFKNSVMTDQT